MYLRAPIISVYIEKRTYNMYHDGGTELVNDFTVVSP